MGTTFTNQKMEKRTFSEKIYYFLFENRYAILFGLAFILAISAFHPVFAQDLFTVGETAARTLTTRLTNIFLVAFGAVVVICAFGLLFSKDPKKADVYKTWMLRALVAFIIVGGWKLVSATIGTLTNNAITLPDIG